MPPLCKPPQPLQVPGILVRRVGVSRLQAGKLVETLYLRDGLESEVKNLFKKPVPCYRGYISKPCLYIYSIYIKYTFICVSNIRQSFKDKTRPLVGSWVWLALVSAPNIETSRAESPRCTRETACSKLGRCPLLVAPGHRFEQPFRPGEVHGSTVCPLESLLGL